jgi:hypothetical protein
MLHQKLSTNLPTEIPPVRRDPRALADSNRLPVLAESIKGYLAAAEIATRRALEHAIAVGRRRRRGAR